MIDFLRRRASTLSLLLALAAASRLVAASVADQLTLPEAQDLQREARLVVDLLQNHHYGGRTFREMDSATMLGRYLNELDPRAEFFQVADVERVHRRFDHTLRSVYLFRGDLQPAFEIFDLFVERARQRLDWVQERLDRGFEFESEETFTDRRDPQPFPTTAQADEHWELQLKAAVLSERLRGRTTEEAIAEVKRFYARAARSIAAYDPLAVRERFFDAIIRSYDPHSGYFSSDSTREFAVEMEKALVGLGVELRREEGRCLVSALQTGGPAELDGSIGEGDVILALAEGDTGDWKELDRLRLREIVTLMRGTAGTRVRLAYLRGGQGERRETTLERRRVELADERARGSVSELPATGGGKRRIGVVQLPSFYAAGEKSALSSAARDVRELLTQMDPATLDGLVLDLRGNPGGALNEAAALSELFIPRGIMMLSHGLDGKVKQHPIKEGAPLYSGPLVVLISANSASASEVFSGAMRYHRRAVIVGAPATFGKGTMQAYIELAKSAPAEGRNWGTLRVTTEKFFQPDGSSVQCDGVRAHVEFPADTLEPPVQREPDLPGALPPEAVPAPDGLVPAMSGEAAVSADLVARLTARLKSDTASLPEWQLRHDEHERAAKHFEDRTRPLLYTAASSRWTEEAAAWHELNLRRRALLAREAFASRPCEVPAAQAQIAAEDERLRRPAGGVAPGAIPPFVLVTDQGHRRKLDPATINFPRYEPDAAALATALAAAGGPAWSAEEIGRFLRQAGLLRYKTAAAIETLAGEIFPADDDRVRRHHHLEQLLQCVAALDGEIPRERPGLDVELREAQRLANEWADWNQTAGRHP